MLGSNSLLKWYQITLKTMVNIYEETKALNIAFEPEKNEGKKPREGKKDSGKKKESDSITVWLGIKQKQAWFLLTTAKRWGSRGDKRRESYDPPIILFFSKNWSFDGSTGNKEQKSGFLERAK